VYSIERDHEFQSTVYDGDDDTAAILDLEFQCVAFTKLLESELFKINRFFTSSMQYYVDTMHVSHFCHLNLLFFFVFESLVSFSEL